MSWSKFRHKLTSLVIFKIQCKQFQIWKLSKSVVGTTRDRRSTFSLINLWWALIENSWNYICGAGNCRNPAEKSKNLMKYIDAINLVFMISSVPQIWVLLTPLCCRVVFVVPTELFDFVEYFSISLVLRLLSSQLMFDVCPTSFRMVPFRSPYNKNSILCIPLLLMFVGIRN